MNTITPQASALAQKMRDDPSFKELERSRRNLVRWLLGFLVAVQSTFIGLMAFGRSIVATTMFGVVSIALPLCLIVLLAVLATTGIYVIVSNRRFDRLVASIIENARC